MYIYIRFEFANVKFLIAFISFIVILVVDYLMKYLFMKFMKKIQFLDWKRDRFFSRILIKV